MDHILEYLRTPRLAAVASQQVATNSPVVAANSPSRFPVNAPARVQYAVANPLGSWILIYTNQKVVRKSNITNNPDIRITNPLPYLSPWAGEARASLMLQGSDIIIHLMYCHRPCEKLRSGPPGSQVGTREIQLLGPSAIVFADHRPEMEEALLEHGRLCDCSGLCHSRPPTHPLAPGDRLVMHSGCYYIRACSEQHVIYMSVQEFRNKVEYKAVDAAQAKLMADFVASLPNQPTPLVT